MITIIFILRVPGGHKEVARTESVAVPRAGEWVCLDDQETREVHEVSWDFSAKPPQANVLLRV